MAHPDSSNRDPEVDSDGLMPEDALERAKATLIERREARGRRVREVWIKWAKRQPNPKPSWLVPYDDLDEADKEADRCIGDALYFDGFEAGQRYVTNALAAGRKPRGEQ